jgi:hypothetical protein
MRTNKKSKDNLNQNPHLSNEVKRISLKDLFDLWVKGLVRLDTSMKDSVKI